MDPIGKVVTRFVRDRVTDEMVPDWVLDDGNLEPDSHKCDHGYVYADTKRQLEIRGINPALHDLYAKTKFAIPCPICEFNKRVIRNFAGRRMTWASWQVRYELQGAVETLKEWVPRFTDRAIVITGNGEIDNQRNGKTHAASASLLALLERRVSAKYQNSGDFFWSTYENNINDFGDYVGYLIIDDLGNEQNTAFMRDIIDRMLDRRYRRGFPTIVFSHMGISAIGEKFPRFASRTRACTIVQWIAEPFVS